MVWLYLCGPFTYDCGSSHCNEPATLSKDKGLCEQALVWKLQRVAVRRRLGLQGRFEALKGLVWLACDCDMRFREVYIYLSTAHIGCLWDSWDRKHIAGTEDMYIRTKSICAIGLMRAWERLRSHTCRNSEHPAANILHAVSRLAFACTVYRSLCVHWYLAPSL